jgi:hypothetical protein
VSTIRVLGEENDDDDDVGEVRIGGQTELHGENLLQC